jgi:pyruvate-formate lyase
MASLYSIRQEIENFEYEVDPETGEILNELSWDDLQMAFDEKVENIACCIKNLASDALAFKAEEEQLAKRRRSTERKIEYLKRLLADNMDGQKFSTAKCAVSFRPSETVEVDDVRLLPAELLRVKTNIEADKTAIKAALKAGQAVDGCRLVKSISTQIK